MLTHPSGQRGEREAREPTMQAVRTAALDEFPDLPELHGLDLGLGLGLPTSAALGATASGLGLGSPTSAAPGASTSGHGSPTSGFVVPGSSSAAGHGSSSSASGHGAASARGPQAAPGTSSVLAGASKGGLPKAWQDPMEAAMEATDDWEAELEENRARPRRPVGNHRRKLRAPLYTSDSSTGSARSCFSATAAGINEVDEDRINFQALSIRSEAEERHGKRGLPRLGDGVEGTDQAFILRLKAAGLGPESPRDEEEPAPAAEVEDYGHLGREGFEHVGPDPGALATATGADARDAADPAPARPLQPERPQTDPHRRHQRRALHNYADVQQARVCPIWAAASDPIPEPIATMAPSRPRVPAPTHRRMLHHAEGGEGNDDATHGGSPASASSRLRL